MSGSQVFPPNSNPGWPKGFIPTAAQWATAFSDKADSGAAQALDPTLTNPFIPAGAPTNGIIVPYYLYPNNPYNDPTVLSLLNLIRAYHTVPCIVIVNQPGETGTGGPGPVWDGNIAAFITLLQGAGATVLGYVDTGFGAVAQATVESNVLLWNQLYVDTPLNGIFFDEFPFDPSFIPQYQGYYSYVHTNGYSLVVGNPGTNEGGAWYASTTADIMVINENSTWISEADAWGNFVGGHSNYLWSLNAVLVYDQTYFDTGQFNTIRKYAKWFYITSGNLPNPWLVLSPYLEQMFAACSTVQGANYVYEQPATGFNITLTSPITILDPSTSLSSGTIVFPPSPLDGDKVLVTSSQSIGSLTLSGNGNTISNAVSAMVSGGSFAYLFQEANTTWYSIENPPGSGSSTSGQGGITTTGSTLADAVPVTAGINILTTVAPGTGAILPASPSLWAQQQIINEGVNAALLYPASGAQIESLGDNEPILVPAGGIVTMTPTTAPPVQWVAR